MPLRLAGTRIVKNAHHSGVAPLQHPHDPALTAPVGLRRFYFDQHLVALHGAVDLVWRDEDVFLSRRLAHIWPYKSVAVPVQIEPPCGQIFARPPHAGNHPGNAPVLPVQQEEFAARRQPGKLFQQQAPLPPAAQSQFAHKLLVSGLLTGRAGNPCQQFTIGHTLRVGYWQTAALFLVQPRGKEQIWPCRVAGTKSVKNKLATGCSFYKRAR